MKYNATNGFTIEIDLERDNLLIEGGHRILADRYLTPEESSPQEAFARAACAFADDEAHAQRLYDYASKLWFMYSTPVLSNGGTRRGLPISCFLNYAEDSIEGLGDNFKEDMCLSKNGGGIGTYYGAVRSMGEKTSTGNSTEGIMPFIRVKDTLTQACKQGSSRRGACAIYIDVSHPEIETFLNMRRPDIPATERAAFLHHGINITDKFMQAVEREDRWELIDPNSQKVKKVVSARELWLKILKARLETGEPYLHFIDTSNADLPLPLKAKGLRINTSNLCNEIYLPTAPDRTAVCCLSSVNVEKWDEWNTNDLFIEDLVRMLDNVLQVFIDQAPDSMWRAKNSAISERSLGLGAMGWHSFLQSKMIPMESPMASGWNNKIFAHIFHNARIASGKLAEERGEAPDMKGTGYRNAHLIALAPNASSSIICGGVSPSIEPANNIDNKKTLSGQFIVRNKYLEKLLEEKGMNTPEVWMSIANDGDIKGSVQHLDFLDEVEKSVFKTPFEIDQMTLVEQAAHRQNYIDQGQSFNIFMRPTEKVSTLHKVHKEAWKRGLKGMYYCRSLTTAKADVSSKNSLDKAEEVGNNAPNDNEEDCTMCEG
jgi:ribonucleoside-diphosphate reductase alpha chain